MGPCRPSQQSEPVPRSPAPAHHHNESVQWIPTSRANPATLPALGVSVGLTLQLQLPLAIHLYSPQHPHCADKEIQSQAIKPAQDHIARINLQNLLSKPLGSAIFLIVFTFPNTIQSSCLGHVVPTIPSILHNPRGEHFISLILQIN